MYIIVVGAGMGGLATALSLAQSGHQVTILESATTLAEIGAGVQMTPNATKYLWKWGLGPDILASASLPGGFFVRDGQSGSTLGSVPFEPFDALYGAPYLVIHRADIHRILHAHAVRAGVQVRLDCRVEDFDFELGHVVLAKTREKLHADLIVGADGVNSSARKALCGSELAGDAGSNGIEKTGWAPYRIIANMANLQAQAEPSSIAALVAEHNCNCWVGSECLLMMYLVKGSSILNIVVSHRDDVDTSAWTQDQYKSALQTLTRDFHPSLKALLDLAEPGIQNWPISQVQNLPRWTSDSGRFVLLGDAAHAMAFYLSMGVSMAIEDAAALTECLALQQLKKTDLNHAMKVFERVRKQRAEAVRDASLHGGNVLQLSHGPDRVIRDHALMRDGLADEKDYGDAFYKTALSYGIADRRIRDWCYGYDVLEAVRAAWDA